MQKFYDFSGEINVDFMITAFSKSSDILLRPVLINGSEQMKVYLFCVDGLVDAGDIDEAILRPISLDNRLAELKTMEEVYARLLNGGAYHCFTDEETDMKKLCQKVLSGQAGLIFPQLKKALIFDVRSFAKRSIDEPSDENVLKGAKDCFIEAIRTNTSLIRRRIRSPYLVIEQSIVGEQSKTDYAIAYMSNICDPKLVEEVKQRVSSINVDNIATPAFVEEFIMDNPRSVFPQVFYSQRPDRVSSNLTDGRVALIVDGMPMVYMLPCQLPSLMQSPEDYAQNYIISSSLRFLRWLSIVISLLLPAFYIAVSSFHFEMLPMQLAVAIQNAKRDVPFATPIEVLGLLIAFEILMEAGLRLSSKIGQAMSVVGALVVGQAAVDAKLVSPAVLIVVATTAVAGFTIPNQDLSNSFRVCRFVIAILASFAGLYGLFVGIIAVLIHLCSLDNYGISYLSPLVDSDEFHYKDTIVRFPVSFFKLRPYKLAERNKRKQGE